MRRINPSLAQREGHNSARKPFAEAGDFRLRLRRKFARARKASNQVEEFAKMAVEKAVHPAPVMLGNHRRSKRRVVSLKRVEGFDGAVAMPLGGFFRERQQIVSGLAVSGNNHCGMAWKPPADNPRHSLNRFG